MKPINWVRVELIRADLERQNRERTHGVNGFEVEISTEAGIAMGLTVTPFDALMRKINGLEDDPE